jgi:nucleotide-binding universal stress UspA family protein
MPPTYIAGYDGSIGARAATRFATRLAAATGADVVVATVQPERFTSWRRREGDEFAHPDGSVTSCFVVAPSPAAGLARLAMDRCASLVLVGAGDAPAWGRDPRSVAEGLLRRANCPLAVVPPAWRDVPIRSLAVAHGGDDSGDALRAARHLAEQLELQRLLVIGVYDPAAAGSCDEWCKHQEQEVEHIVATMPRPPVAEAWFLSGTGGATLVDACREHVDLLIVGSRAYGSARNTLTRSVSRHVVENARCPVLVVPQAVDAAAEAASCVSAVSVDG